MTENKEDKIQINSKAGLQNILKIKMMNKVIIEKSVFQNIIEKKNIKEVQVEINIIVRINIKDKDIIQNLNKEIKNIIGKNIEVEKKAIIVIKVIIRTKIPKKK